MKITRCKLTKKQQLKLLEFFVAQVTARTASDLLGIQHNSSALFYHKIRLVIEYHLNQDAKRVLRKYNGIDKKNFHLFIKECEFRFNYGTPSNQLKVLRKWCGI